MLDWPEAALLMLGGVTTLILAGIPVGLAFFVINLVGAWLFLGGDAGIAQFLRSAVVSINSFALTPIPFFILMGEVLFRSGVALRAIDAIDRAIPRVPGRMAVVAIVAGSVFSAISGSTIATTAILGTALLPQMLKRGYAPKMAMGPIMAIGGVDALIPPSALAVLLGSLSQIPIAPLLIGGIVPGLILATMFIGWIVLSCALVPGLAPDPPQGVLDPRGRLWPLVTDVLPLVLIFGVAVGSMVGGIATPTESGAIGAAATIAVVALYRALSFRALWDALMGTAAVSGAIVFILMGAFTFSQILSFSGVLDGATTLVREAGLSTTTLLVVMLATLVVLGFFIDQVSTMLMTLPFFMPMLAGTGTDLVWFGILYLMCLQLGLITPPFGLILFVMKGVAPPGITMLQVFGAALPYCVLGLGGIVLVFLVPDLATWLPAILLR